MRTFLLPISALCFAACLLHGCKKHEGIPRSSTYTFINQTGRRITLDFYGSKQDYGRETNRIGQYILNEGAEQKLDLNVGQSYWIDWYSDGYTYNNWEPYYAGARPEPELLSVAAADDSRIIRSNMADTTRSIMLNGGTSSSWKGTLTGLGQWDGTYELVFRKDMTGDFRFTNGNGAVSGQPITYLINDIRYNFGKTDRFSLYIMNTLGQAIFMATCNLGTLQHTGRDAMIVQLEQQSLPQDLVIARQ